MSTQAPPAISFKGAVYVKVAQLQPLLQQFETEAGAQLKSVSILKSTLANAHKAVLNNKDAEKKETLGQLEKLKKAAPELAQQFEKEVVAKANSLIETTNTIAGHIGMGGA